jgi:hypothetical protein
MGIYDDDFTATTPLQRSLSPNGHESSRLRQPCVDNPHDNVDCTHMWLKYPLDVGLTGYHTPATGRAGRGATSAPTV